MWIGRLLAADASGPAASAGGRGEAERTAVPPDEFDKPTEMQVDELLGTLGVEELPENADESQVQQRNEKRQRLAKLVADQNAKRRRQRV